MPEFHLCAARLNTEMATAGRYTLQHSIGKENYTEPTEEVK